MVNIQVTISGTDFNGFVWQNVFYLTCNNGIANIFDTLDATNTHVHGILMTPLRNCMSNQNTILDISSRYVKPDSSYSISKVENSPGNRDALADSGAIAGKIQWLTLEGPETGRQYITGVCEDDYQNDFITDAYAALLDTLGTAFESLAGTVGGFTWDFVVYSKGDVPTVDSIIGHVIYLKAGVLSKRIRA